MNLCVIPARGGSKRIPRKNIKDFCGKPMIAYSIQAALQSECFDHVIVSTDDEEIAEVALSYGAEVPFMRPVELSDDFSTTGDVVRHTIAYFEQNNKKIELVHCLYATAPFVQTKSIIKGLESLINTKCDYALAVTAYNSPIQRAWIIDEHSKLKFSNPKYFSVRSQDLKPHYYDVGQFCWGTVQAWLENKSFDKAHVYPIIIPSYLSQDIDTSEDWVRAEIMYKVLLSLGE